MGVEYLQRLDEVLHTQLAEPGLKPRGLIGKAYTGAVDVHGDHLIIAGDTPAGQTSVMETLLPVNGSSVSIFRVNDALYDPSSCIASDGSGVLPPKR